MEKTGAEIERVSDAKQDSGSWIKRLLPLVILALAIGAVFASGLHHYLTFDALREHRETLLRFVADNPLLAPLTFMVIYALATALSVPGGIILTIAGGFMFGTWLGGLYVVIGATIGASAIFLIAKTALGNIIARKGWAMAQQDGSRLQGECVELSPGPSSDSTFPVLAGQSRAGFSWRLAWNLRYWDIPWYHSRLLCFRERGQWLRIGVRCRRNARSRHYLRAQHSRSYFSARDSRTFACPL